MKKLALLAAVAALSACNQKTDEAPVATDTPAAEATMAADAGPTPGTYTVKMADGSFTSTSADGKTTVTVTPATATATMAATPAPAAT